MYCKQLSRHISIIFAVPRDGPATHDTFFVDAGSLVRLDPFRRTTAAAARWHPL
jgi:hypothetical protein